VLDQLAAVGGREAELPFEDVAEAVLLAAEPRERRAPVGSSR